MSSTYDFSGWATRNNIKCSDGRTIRKDAFKDNDGVTVPLVWSHRHDDPSQVLGHALCENRDEGVYVYGSFNDTALGRDAKLLVQHGDITALSIYANKLKQVGGDVVHGAIREVSLVLAGANPGAYIDSVISHGDDSEESAIIFTDETIELSHADDETNTKEDEMSKEDSKKRTIGDVLETLNEEQKQALDILIEEALKTNIDDDKGDNDDMKHNVFDTDEKYDENVLSHSEIEAIFSDVKRYGTLKESVLAHGIENIEMLFPEAHNMNNPPEFVKRDDSWVSVVMNGTHHSPFSRIRSTFANITNDEARAKGYLGTYGRDSKGNKMLLDEEGNPTRKPYKEEEVFSLLKRTTTPTTIYKKQKLDRDDVIDIKDFDVVSWLKGEMRMMLNEEIARAILVGDQRLASDDDKINENNIRPIWTDDDFYTIKATIGVASGATADDKARAFIKKAVKARKLYKGSGNPVLFCTEDILTDCLLLEDKNGRIIYDSMDKLATAMRVSKIVTVPVMENLTRSVEGVVHTMGGIIVNLNDYNVGADKGGEVNMFDDFDIDYNAQKYLIETRCSGALTKPYSAIALEFVPAN